MQVTSVLLSENARSPTMISMVIHFDQGYFLTSRCLLAAAVVIWRIHLLVLAYD